MPQNYDVIIIGGGVAGLSAALHLTERGIKPLVLEADSEYFGGRLSGGKKIRINHQDKDWEFREEHGVHGFWASYNNLTAMLQRNGILPNFSDAREETWIYRRGGDISRAEVGSAIRSGCLPAPLHYLNLFMRPRFWNMLGLADILSLPAVLYGLFFAVGIDPLKENQPIEGMRLSHLVKHWGPAVRAFVVGLARNGLSARPEEIQLSGFLAFLRFYTVMRKDSWRFRYLPEDAGTSLVEPLLRAIQKSGGELILGSPVIKINKNELGWQVDCGKYKFQSEAVILATDAQNARTILQNSQSTREKSANMYFPPGIATAIIRIWYSDVPRNGAEAGIFSGEFALDNYFWLHRIFSPYKDWYLETGGSAIEAHIYGPPELLQEEDAGLLARAISDISAAYPELRGKRIDQSITRHPKTHTLFGVGPQGKHLGVETPWPDLYCCGDWVLDPFPALFLERACATGILAANNILDKMNKPAWDVIHPKPPEPFAQFIQSIIIRGRK
ncbi:MAG: FAD-dependent oxidoreductase [Chloroflexota bacterium]